MAVDIICTNHIVGNSYLVFIGKTFSRYDHTNINNGVDIASIMVRTFFIS